MATAIPTLRLKQGAEKRVKQGHPWVFSNELQEVPKGLEAGSPVHLSDAGGKPLAVGYANPKSLIVFRRLQIVLGEFPNISQWYSEAAFEARLLAAWKRRSPYHGGSFRWVFSEGDQLPGIVIDRFLTSDGSFQVVVVQILTAGMEKAFGLWRPALESVLKSQTAELGSLLLIQRDSFFRTHEGLENREPESIPLGKISAPNLKHISIKVEVAKRSLNFDVDLLDGQKTGFFLDQRENIAKMFELLSSATYSKNQNELRILDLCTYVGQWGAFASAALSTRSIRGQVHGVDVSAQALSFAKSNVERVGAKFTPIEADVMGDLTRLEGSFDVVICDPPAFVKSAKVLPQAKQAYVKLNEAAMRKLLPGGWFVSCSCSYHLKDADFEEVLVKAQGRAQKNIQWIYRGGQAQDHPILLEFPEGRYLKAWIGREMSDENFRS